MSFFEFPHTRTYDSDLGWLIKDYKTLNEAIDALNHWKEETQPTIDDLAHLYEQLVKGNLPPAMTEAIVIWLKANAGDLLSELIKCVFFDLNNDGYFVAHVPNSWNDVIFGTSGLDTFPPGVDFGHLVLNY